MDLLDNLEVIKQRDPEDALGIIANSAELLTWDADFVNFRAEDLGGWRPTNIVLSGMGGSAIGGLIIKAWLDQERLLDLPFEVSRNYYLPNWVDSGTLAIIVSVSGNTEETLSSLDDALDRGAKVAIITTGGKLLDRAMAENLPFIQIKKVMQPRHGVLMHLRAITQVLTAFGLANGAHEQLAAAHDFAQAVPANFTSDVPSENNFAKQLALLCVGKTPLIYASSQFAPIAYKWKISFNENARNIAWTGEFPEFNHNEMMGWTSHPIEKPFAVLNLRSNLDSPRVNQRFDLSTKMLSGKRPTPREIWLDHDTIGAKTLLEQMIYGFMLADFAAIYVAILNNVNPSTSDFVEQFKKELA